MLRVLLKGMDAVPNGEECPSLAAGQTPEAWACEKMREAVEDYCTIGISQQYKQQKLQTPGKNKIPERTPFREPAADGGGARAQPWLSDAQFDAVMAQIATTHSGQVAKCPTQAGVVVGAAAAVAGATVVSPGPAPRAAVVAVVAGVAAAARSIIRDRCGRRSAGCGL